MLYTRPEHEAIRQAWRTIALFCVTECLPDDVITDKTELLDAGLSDDDADASRRTSQYMGNLKHTAHGFDTELSLMFFGMKTYSFQALS